MELNRCLAAVESNPNDIKALMDLGGAYHHSGKKLKAIETLEKAIKLNVNLPNLWPYGYLSAAYYDLGNYESACQVLGNGIVEKLDAFRGKEEILGLQEHDNMLREYYMKWQEAAFYRFNTKAGKAARTGANRAAQSLGYADSLSATAAQIKATGTFELAKKVAKKGAVSTIPRIHAKRIFWTTVLLILIFTILFDHMMWGIVVGLIIGTGYAVFLFRGERILKSIKKK